MTGRAKAEAARAKQVQEARDHARAFRDRHIGRPNIVGEPAEEIAELTDAVGWLAAEFRCDRIERHDRIARVMETGDPLPRQGRGDPDFP